MTTGSAQLRTYRIARRAGKSTNDSALEAGITMGEARLIDADDAKNPPPEEAYLPLGNTERTENMGDPFEALGIGLAEDHKAEKAKRGRKPKAETAPAAATEDSVEQAGNGDASADAPVSGGDTASSVVTDNATGDTIIAGALSTGPAAVDESPASVIAATDPAAIFDRRIERLVRIAESAKFEGGSLFGDFRSAVLEIFKHRPKVWTAMSSDEQRQLVTFVEATCKRFLERIVLVVAEDGGESLQATFLGNFTVKGETIEAKVKIDGVDNDVLASAFGLAGHRIIISTADSKRFMGAGTPPQIDPDQLGMGFGDGPAAVAPAPAAQPAPERPDNDSDLAGDDDKPNAEAQDEGGAGDPPQPQDLEPDARYRIKATSDGAYLVDPDGDTTVDAAWTNVLINAGTWDAEETANLLDEFGGPSEVTAEKVEG